MILMATYTVIIFTIVVPGLSQQDHESACKIIAVALAGRPACVGRFGHCMANPELSLRYIAAQRVVMREGIVHEVIFLG